MKKNILVGTALVALLIGGGVYYKGIVPETQAKEAQAIQAIPVVVQTLEKQKARVWSEFSGRLHAVDAAEIRPEVSGRITEVLFADGQNVNQDDVLFVIDPRPFEANVARAEASLVSAKTNAEFAQKEMDRAAGMIKSQAIAQRLFDERANANRVAQASVKMAEAELKQARLDLEHAHVKAPISGRVSRAEITVGNLVQAGLQAPLLTTIVSDKNVYADFEVDEQTYTRSIRQAVSSPENDKRVPIEMTLQSDATHPYNGTIDSFDNHIDVASGTIRARAKFDNTDGVLIPGMFVSVRLANANDSDEVLVPERALGFDQSKKFVFVVGKDNKVSYREVQLGDQIGGSRIVLSGVKPGERVIVEGMQHVKPDALVQPKEISSIEPAAGKPVAALPPGTETASQK